MVLLVRYNERRIASVANRRASSVGPIKFCSSLGLTSMSHRLVTDDTLSFVYAGSAICFETGLVSVDVLPWCLKGLAITGKSTATRESLGRMTQQERAAFGES